MAVVARVVVDGLVLVRQRHRGAAERCLRPSKPLVVAAVVLRVVAVVARVVVDGIAALARDAVHLLHAAAEALLPVAPQWPTRGNGRWAHGAALVLGEDITTYFRGAEGRG